MTPFLWTMLGFFTGVLLVGFVAIKLWTIQECKFRAELETVETENGVLRMQVNGARSAAKVPARATMPGLAGVDRGEKGGPS